MDRESLIQRIVTAVTYVSSGREHIDAQTRVVTDLVREGRPADEPQALLQILLEAQVRNEDQLNRLIDEFNRQQLGSDGKTIGASTHDRTSNE